LEKKTYLPGGGERRPGAGKRSGPYSGERSAFVKEGHVASARWEGEDGARERNYWGKKRGGTRRTD